MEARDKAAWRKWHKSVTALGTAPRPRAQAHQAPEAVHAVVCVRAGAPVLRWEVRTAALGRAPRRRRTQPQTRRDRGAAVTRGNNRLLLDELRRPLQLTTPRPARTMTNVVRMKFPRPSDRRRLLSRAHRQYSDGRTVAEASCQLTTLCQRRPLGNGPVNTSMPLLRRPGHAGCDPSSATQD